MSHILFCGLGYSAREIAARLGARQWTIAATSRTPDGEAEIASRGYRALGFVPGSGIASLHAHPSPTLETLTHLLVSAPPDDVGDPLLETHMADLALAPNLEWIGYLSTVGVYGDHHGAWVDETTVPAPASPRARRRLAAEESWFAFGHRTGRTVAVFRLAGIYGPGRSAVDQVLGGTARCIVKPGQVFNRIHVDDIATAVIAAIDAKAGGLFNVADDEPAPPQDVVAHACALLGRPVPPAIAFEAAELSAMALSFYADCRRVSNARLKQRLGVRLAYPSYREGLAALAEASAAKG